MYPLHALTLVLVALLVLLHPSPSLSDCVPLKNRAGDITRTTVNTSFTFFETTVSPYYSLGTVFNFVFTPTSNCTDPYTIYVGDATHGIHCPNDELNNATFERVDGSTRFNLSWSGVSVYSLGIVSPCSGGLTYSPRADCGSPCIPNSYCSNHGCVCLPRYYTYFCNISGECDPESPPQGCEVQGGNGIGKQSCLFADSGNTLTMWGPCVLEQCAEGYKPVGDRCVKEGASSSSTTGDSSDAHPLNEGLRNIFFIGLMAVGAFLIVLMTFLSVRRYRSVRFYQSVNS